MGTLKLLGRWVGDDYGEDMDDENGGDELILYAVPHDWSRIPMF